MKLSFVFAGCALLLPALASAQTGPGDLVIPAGQTRSFNTQGGPIIVGTLRIEQGATLLVRGNQPFRVRALAIEIDGVLDISGFDAPDVFTLNTANIPEPGAVGGPSAGRGGTGSENTTDVTPAGGDGFGPRGLKGGRGGESGFHPSGIQSGALRRPGGGGGGVFGPPQPVVPGDPENSSNQGLLALAGVDGNAAGFGAISQANQPAGGSVGTLIFVDALTANDFFGRKNDPGGAIVGELAAPIPGQGGGAGGDAVRSSSFPPLFFSLPDQDKGAAGGGGGGLGVLVAGTIAFGAEGRIVADGGRGGAGENTSFINRVGGGGGGGSGGMILLQAGLIDLSASGPETLRALGGLGGNGAGDVLRAECGGGHGGPGLIQLHVPGGDPARVLLPAGTGLGGVTLPAAHVLQLEPNV